MRLLIIISFLILTSCATPYQKSGFLGGYEDHKIGPDTYSITVNGNGYTSLSSVKNMALRRAFELCPKGYSILGFDGDKNSNLSTGFNGNYTTVTKSSTILVIQCNKGD